MKNKLYIAFATTLIIFAACTKHTIDSVQPVPDTSRSYIFFEPEVVESVTTKTETVSSIKLSEIGTDAFGVMGYHNSTALFQHPEYNFTSTEGGSGSIARVYPKDDVYKYDHLQPWMSSGKHTFYAFYPYTNLKGKVCMENGAPYIMYNADTDSSVDVLTDVEEVSISDGTSVGFELEHRLCALYLKIVNTQESGSGDSKTYPQLVLKKVELKVEVPAGGKIYLASKNITLNKDEADPAKTSYKLRTYTLLNEPATIASKSATNNYAEYGPILFLPGGGLQYRVDITYVNALDQDDTFSYPKEANTYQTASAPTSFVGGTKYTLTINRTVDTFVTGNYEDPDGEGSLQAGAWKDVSVQHTFN